jgi:hypothetical protein
MAIEAHSDQPDVIKQARNALGILGQKKGPIAR